MDARVLQPAAIAHKANPAVKDLIIIVPRSIGLFAPFDHGRETVVSLAVPRLFDDGAGDGFLPGRGQALHRRF